MHRLQRLFALSSSTHPALSSVLRPLPVIAVPQQRYYAKDIRFGAEARRPMLHGVDVLADAVAVTMGPKVNTCVRTTKYKGKVNRDKGLDLVQKQKL